MITVQFPEPEFKLKKEGEKRFVFDTIRKAWLLLTEEEWVRQNFVAYLVKQLHYPETLIALEKEILLNGLKKRFDILVYDRSHQPWMLIECKAPEVLLSEDVLQQALRYNITVPVNYIVITNGNNTVAWEKTGERLNLIQLLPSFN
ncbi:MAG: type I restriction enzyme HsdR N-terminal domain-containing protein [Chitinophagaceae bacterium]|nr:MAG: type I restriction enzyme HsdR N-terminal domain-containing protein [Chitinophagaceae bacterium]